LNIETPLGKIGFSFTVNGSFYSDSDNSYTMLKETYNPQFPEGMSVQKCIVVALYINASKDFQDMSFFCEWVGSHPVEFGTETGEGLEAQAWEDKKHTVMIGTEDDEFALKSFPKGIALSSKSDFVEYSSKGMRINLKEIPANSELCLHFIVSWNKLPEPEDSSCWYAVHKDSSVIKRIIETNRTLQRKSR
jgi:hypothetical protein